MIDFIGKKLYAGSQEIANAYLGEEMFFGGGETEYPFSPIPGMNGENLEDKEAERWDKWYYDSRRNWVRTTTSYISRAREGGLLHYVTNNSPWDHHSLPIIPSNLGVGWPSSRNLFTPVTYPVPGGNYILKYSAKSVKGNTGGFLEKYSEKGYAEASVRNTYTGDWQTFTYEFKATQKTFDFAFTMTKDSYFGTIFFRDFELISLN